MNIKTMKTNLLLARAIAITSEAFVTETDRGGRPCILHCLYVMHKVKHLGDIAMICGVTHDLIEDTEWTLDDLKDIGFPQEVLSVLDLLTHRPEVDYIDYIKALALNPVARAVKMADLEHNTKVTRLKGLRKKDLDRLQKYMIAYEYLKD